MAVTTTRRNVRAGAWLPVGLTAVAALLTLDPATVGLSDAPWYAQLISFRLVTGVGLVVAGLLVAALLLLPRPTRPWLRLTLAGALLVAGLGQGVVQLARGWGGSERSGAADLVVLSYNTERGASDAGTIAVLAHAEDAQVLALPETPLALAEQVAERLSGSGHTFQVFSNPGSLNLPTSLLVRSDLGTYAAATAPDTGYGTVRAVPVDGRGPVLAAVHSVAPPTGWGGDYAIWETTTRTAVALCTDSGNAVVAGDFNTTTDHAALRGLGSCADAAAGTGRGAEGTWPSNLPAFLATRIDHVLYPTATWRALSTHTVRVGGSDHRALIARLARIG